ncbi:uncharacterized protein LOC124119854 [Haliotis rufescens]|uniref:uncharacterized protein LOC124119854 n=1 Tax=Haliotis rufescens TaxID=6454 RepID=UPI00201F7189|nr:uncharacterized protein LOC124119854 [Haliotis rufescens]XP_048247404.1 uncharacterized protein LOC124119854 [Haliotis rufescens]XP_048247405.1 uncharacterized protein LOC124119854 [Haliotis rufescens]
MSAPQTSNVLISTRSNQHLSAVGDPPRLTFVTGADQKQRIRETFLSCTSISETQMPPVMTITFSHEVKGHVYDVTARADGTVELLDHSSLPSTAFQDGRHFLISQEFEKDVSYVVFQSVKFPGNYLCCHDNTLQLRNPPDAPEERTAFHFDLMQI